MTVRRSLAQQEEYRMRDGDAAGREPGTEAGRSLLATLRSFVDMEIGHPTWLATGAPQLVRAIEAEAGRLDVERLTVALWGLDGASVDARKLAEQIIAEYERIGPMP